MWINLFVSTQLSDWAEEPTEHNRPLGKLYKMLPEELSRDELWQPLHLTSSCG